MKNQIHAVAAALSVGIVWALSLLITSLISVKNGYGREFLDMLSSIYLGYGSSAKGILLGTTWAFFDGFIGTWILVSVYNFFAKRLK